MSYLFYDCFCSDVAAYAPRARPPNQSPDDHSFSPLWIVLYAIFYLLCIFAVGAAAGNYLNAVWYPLVFVCALAVLWRYKRQVKKGLLDPNRARRADLFRAFSHAFFGGGLFAILCESFLSLILLLIFWQHAKKLADEDKLSKLRNKPEVYFYLFFTAYLVAGFVEEATKGMVLQHCSKLYLAHPRHLRRIDLSSFLWLGTCVGLGFGTMEGVLYTCIYAGGHPAAQPFVWLIRVLLAIPFHSCMGFMWGLQLARREVGKEPLSWFKMGYKQVLWHGTYDFLEMVMAVLMTKPMWGLVLLLLGIAVVVLILALFAAVREYKSYLRDQELVMLHDQEGHDDNPYADDESPFPNDA